MADNPNLAENLDACLKGAQAGDRVRAAEAAVLTYAIDKSPRGIQCATLLLYEVLGSDDVDLLMEVGNAIVNGWGIFQDKKLAARFFDRMRSLSYKGHYLFGFNLFNEHKQLARRSLVISSRHGHVASKILIFMSYRPRNVLADFLLFRPLLVCFGNYVILSALFSSNPAERFWRYRDVFTQGLILVERKMPRDRKTYLSPVLELIKSAAP